MALNISPAPEEFDEQKQSGFSEPQLATIVAVIKQEFAKREQRLQQIEEQLQRIKHQLNV